MNDDQLLRYSRQIMLSHCDIAGQQKLLSAKILIVGAGGLGAAASLYLAAAGVGQLTIYDADDVDLSNLQRQIVHYTTDIGLKKVISTQQTLKKINPEVKVVAVARHLQAEELDIAVSAADIVLDCSDNFTTRFAINTACVKWSKPLVSGAAIRFEAQISVFAGGNNQPCYNCLYPQQGQDIYNCATQGIIAPLVGIIGSMQALEALKYILQIGDGLQGRVLVLDALTMEWRSLRLKKNPECPTCSVHPY
ncbi:MAG: hypothetical protein RL637_25 [Pseudomonadota bacterium]|jgi:adenylyltransferase/sulfurtransferase